MSRLIPTSRGYLTIQATLIVSPVGQGFRDVEHLPDAEEEVPEHAAHLRPDLSTPQLTQQRVQRPRELPQPRSLEPLQLREEQQQHRGPGVTVRLAAQGEEVANHLSEDDEMSGFRRVNSTYLLTQRQQSSLYVAPTI